MNKISLDNLTTSHEFFPTILFFFFSFNKKYLSDNLEELNRALLNHPQNEPWRERLFPKNGIEITLNKKKATL